MLYLLSDLSGTLSPLNVFRYITFRTGGALFTAGLFVFWFGPLIISLLRLRQGKGQPIREDGPQTHLTKRGTPTMGGLMILAGAIVAILPLGQPAQSLRLGDPRGDPGLWCHRLLRRLSQGDEAVA